MRKYCLFLLPLLLLQCNNSPGDIQSVDGEPIANVEETPPTNPSNVLTDGEVETASSLLAQRSAVNQEAVMNSLISAGTPLYIEYQAPLAKTVKPAVLNRSELVPSAYTDLSIFTYLDDLLRFGYYKSKGLTIESLGPLSAAVLPGLDHQALAYPLVRQNYWAEGGRVIPNGNANYRSVPGGMPKVEDLQNDPYRALISLHELSLNKLNVEKLRSEQERKYYLFYEEHPVEQAPNPYNPQPSLLATMVYQKAKGLIEVKRKAQEARLKVLAGQLDVNRTDVAINTTLDEILSIQQRAFDSYAVEEDIRSFFDSSYRYKEGASGVLMKKANRLRRYFQQPTSPQHATRLTSNHIKLIQAELQSSLLSKEGKEYLRSKYDWATRSTAGYQQMKVEMEALLARLGNYQMTTDEGQYFASILANVQHLIDTWQIATDQFKELHKLPAEEKLFDLIPLVQLGESELEQKLSATPGVKYLDLTMRKLQTYYYQQLREAEAAFQQ